RAGGRPPRARPCPARPLQGAAGDPFPRGAPPQRPREGEAQRPARPRVTRARSTYEFAALSTTELAALMEDEPPILLLPVGSTEAHGPHLPLATDVLIAQETARRAAGELAAREVTALVLPPLAYAVTEFVAAFRGTISVRAETVRTLLEEIARSLFGQGFPLVVLVNGHVEPEHARMLKHVARDVTAASAGVLLFP